MLEREPENLALDKYAVLGDILTLSTHVDQHESHEQLIKTLRNWVDDMKLPKLSEFGLNETGLDNVIKHCRGSSMKTNPIVMTDGEVRELLIRRL